MNDPVQSVADSAAANSLESAVATAVRRWGRTWVEIDPAALRRNWRRIVATLPARGFCIACVKKEGYGHGLIEVARALAGEPSFWGVGVATLEEAVLLRDATAAAGTSDGGCAPIAQQMPILILVPLAGDAIEEAIRLRATLTITTLVEAKAAQLAAQKLNSTATVHFKLDTGMGRLGRLPDEAAAEFNQIRALPNLRIEAIFSHLADAWNDPRSRADQRLAMDRFLETAIAADPSAAALPIHWGGSDALSFISELPPGSGLRVGIALYGDHPSADFEPAMTFKTRVVYRRKVPAGTAISYGSTFTTRRVSELAVIGAGYGNGLLRALSNKGEVLIAGKRCPILGRVCMDQTVVDVTDLVAAKIEINTGDEVVIFGKQTLPDGSTAILPAAEQAAKAGTISYELFCLAGMLNPRFEVK